MPDFIDPVPVQHLFDLMSRLTLHSVDIQRGASQHDPSYMLGWRAATNTAILALWSVLQGDQTLPLVGTLPEDLRRVICSTCQSVQYKSLLDDSHCVDCGGTKLRYYRRKTDVDVRQTMPQRSNTPCPIGFPAPDNDDHLAWAMASADHDRALCDCSECENLRHARASHDFGTK